MPLLFLLTVAQDATACIEVVAIGEELHATEGDKEMGGIVHEQGTHETAVVAAVMVFVVQDEIEGLVLGQSADGRCGMQRLNDFANGLRVVQLEMEIAAQMSQMTGTDGARPRLGEVGRKLFQLLSDVGGNVTLFLDVLIAP